MDSLLASPREAPTDPHLPFQVTFCCLHSEDEKAVILPLKMTPHCHLLEPF